MIEPKIIFENDDVAVIDKPAGLIVHGDGKTTDLTLADWLIQKYPGIAEVGEGLKIKEAASERIINRAGIVHRLDRDTSGVMVVAKTQNAYEFLKQQFQNRSIEKVYRTLVWGIIKDDSGEINFSIGKSRRDPRLWSAENPRGTLRDARTVYKILARFSPKDRGDEGITYVEVYPRTGRTHQIRVHMKAIFHPVVCDLVYAPKKVCPVGSLGRQALHAYSLELELPSGGRKKFEASLADDFKAALEYLGSS